MKPSAEWNANLTLKAQCWLWRNGWGPVLLLFVLCACVLAGLFRQHLEQRNSRAIAQLQELENELSAAHASPRPQPVTSTDTQRMNALQQVVYSSTEINTTVRRVLAMSQEHQVQTLESEYRINAQGFGGLRQQQITLPVQGSYPAIKAYVMHLLGEFPGLSVDQIVLRREDVAKDKPEVIIKVSIWSNTGAGLVDTSSPSAVR